jgi:uncharacterized protein with PQ loop repeat
MPSIDKSYYYYIILFATFLFTFSYIPIVFQIIQQKKSSNIPYLSLIAMSIAFILFLFITISRRYYVHLFFYLVGLISVSIIIFYKRYYENSDHHIIPNNIMKEFKKITKNS